MKRSSPALLAAATALLLAGCAGSPATGSSAGGSASASAAAPQSSAASSSATSSSAAPSAAAGSTIEGTGYAYAVPDGWGEPDADVGQSATDSFAADLEDPDDFADNVNVIVLGAAVTPEQVESQGPAELKGAGATKVSVRDRVAVAGAESAHLTALTSAGDAEYRVDQYYLTHDDQTYVVTFSFSPDVSQADRDDVSRSVLDTWSWT